MDFAKQVIIATFLTGVVGLVLMKGLEHVMKHRNPGMQKTEVEQLFKHMELLAAGLAAAGVLILWSGLQTRKRSGRDDISTSDSAVLGIVQGFCLPFRGFSRSGSTISVGLLRGMAKVRVEAFSFALALVLTPFLIAWEGRRLIHDHHNLRPVIHQGLLGMILSFVSGLVALALLSKLLERGAWWIFGVYCFLAAGSVMWMYHAGMLGPHTF
jgi:undecaprenyl-diphosphatase